MEISIQVKQSRKIMLCQQISTFLLEELNRLRRRSKFCKTKKIALYCSPRASFNIQVIQMLNKFGLVEETRGQQAILNPQALSLQLSNSQQTIDNIIQPSFDANTNDNRIYHLPPSNSLIIQKKPSLLGRNSPKPKALGLLFSSINQIVLEEKLKQCFQFRIQSRHGISESQGEWLWVPESQSVQEYILQEMPFLNGEESRHYFWLLSKNKVISRYLQYVYDTQRLMFLNDLLVAAYYILQALQPHRHFTLSNDQVRDLSQDIFPPAFSHPQLKQLRLHLAPSANNQLVIVAPPCLIQAAQLFTQAIIVAATICAPQCSTNRRHKKKYRRMKRIRRVPLPSAMVIRNSQNEWE